MPATSPQPAHQLAKAKPSELAKGDSGTVFAPSEAQAKLLNHFIDNDYKCNLTQACAKCGVGVRTYYHWTEHGDFCAWWQAQSKRWAAMHLPKVRAAVIAAATEAEAPGSLDAMKLALDKFDDHLPARAQDDGGVPRVSYNIVENLQILLDSGLTERYHPNSPSVAEVLAGQLGMEAEAAPEEAGSAVMDDKPVEDR